MLGDVELEKIKGGQEAKGDKEQASLGKDNVEGVDEKKKEKDPVTLFKAKVHQETSSENVDRNEEKDIDVTVEASKPTESSSQIKIKAGDASVTQTISNNHDGTFSFEVSKKNVDGQEEGETKTEKITVDTTQMPGLFNEVFSTMANGGPFDLLQQQEDKKQEDQ